MENIFTPLNAVSVGKNTGHNTGGLAGSLDLQPVNKCVRLLRKVGVFMVQDMIGLGADDGDTGKTGVSPRRATSKSVAGALASATPAPLAASSSAARVLSTFVSLLRLKAQAGREHEPRSFHGLTARSRCEQEDLGIIDGSGQLGFRYRREPFAKSRIAVRPGG